ncbi:MAG: YicC family protein [Myxococcales bacterium]|nr:YicC family protein [Myxococcales bacterium]
MIRSMTGFGEGAASVDGVAVSAVARSLNSKGLEVRVAVPQTLTSLEPAITERVRAGLTRGRVELRVDVRGAPRAASDDAALGSLVSRLRAIQHRYDLAGGVTLSDVLQAGGADMLAASAGVLSAELAEEPVLAAVDEAIDALTSFQRREGAALAAAFEALLAELREVLDRVDELAAGHAVDVAARLLARLGELGSAHDDGRVEREVALIAARGDIHEELVRAREHIRAFAAALAGDAGPAPGRRLGFLAQELGRETNTMSAKSASAQLTHEVVRAKELVEQLREQASNVE